MLILQWFVGGLIGIWHSYCLLQDWIIQ